jgi:hypothetical protein
MSMKPAPHCSLVTESSRYARKVVRALRYDGTDLVVDIQGPGFSFARVVFRDPVGFRMLDELELSEFWNTYSEPAGWLWLVESGGWFDLESHRATFNPTGRRLREYLLVDDKCISVLCAEKPDIFDLGSAPENAEA